MSRLAALLGTLAFAVPSTVLGDGFEHPDNGTVGLGRAGAFTARATDGSAVQYNVASFAGQRGTRALLDLNFNDYNICFDRAGTYPANHRDPENVPWAFSGQEFPEVCDEGSFLDGPGPLLAISTDLGSPRGPVLAFGIHGPSSPERVRMPETVTLSDGTLAPAPQRYDLVTRRVIVLYPTLAAGYELLPWLRVGGAFQAVFSLLQFDTVVTASSAQNPSSDLIAHLDTFEPFAPTGIFSVQARQGPFDVGFTLRLPSDLHATGDVTFEPGPFTNRRADGTTIEDPDIVGAESGATVDAAQYPQARFAVRYFHARDGAPAASDWSSWDPMEHEVFDVELDVMWERASEFDSLDIEVEEEALTFSRSLGDIPVIDPIEVDHSWEDVFSFRLGGDFNVLPGRLALRAGASYEPGATPLVNTKVDFLGFRKVGLHLGGTYRLGHWDFSLGGAYLSLSPRNVSGGKAFSLGPTGPVEGDGEQVNDGRWEGNIVVLSLGASYRF